MSITLGLPDNLLNDFNLFATRVPGINVAEKIYTVRQALYDYERKQQIENNSGDKSQGDHLRIAM
jgi:hypothetical protein